jgi:hypothetical protein
VINTDNLRGIGPLDWVYGIKLSFTVPETGCERCSQSGGACGYDTETEVMTCLCSSSTNYTRECGKNSLIFACQESLERLFERNKFIVCCGH